LLFAAEPAVAAWLAWYFLGETSGRARVVR
jgi:hypothetical protein